MNTRRAEMTGEAGFALPSILMLVTILSLVAFSVMAVTYLEYQVALMDASRLKAEFAAQSGVARALAELSSTDALRAEATERVYAFADGGRASVSIHPWGTLFLLESQGSTGRCTAKRMALASCRPGDAFHNALVLGNGSHQLVLTGSSVITGNVATGPGGATTGSIHGYATPVSLPVRGEVLKTSAISFPQSSMAFVHSIAKYYSCLYDGKEDAGGLVSMPPDGALPDVLSDTAVVLSIPGGTVLRDSIARPLHRLYLRCNGVLSIASTARISGAVTVVADSIAVARGAILSGCVLVGFRGIRAEMAFLSSVQLLGPRITLDSGCVADYPSSIFSLPIERGRIGAQRIRLCSGTRVEGFVGMVSPSEEDLSIVEPGVQVLGALFTNARLTMDGTVHGSIVSQDLYFYSSPTTYLGWMRMGVIDRTKLPGGFLVPPIYAGKNQLAVLDW